MKREILRILEAFKLKRLALRISFLFKNSNEKFVKGTRSLLIPMLIHKRQKGGILAVDLCNRQGLGAKLEWSLEIMAYCNENDLMPRFRFSYPDSNDYFANFFYIKGESENNEIEKFTTIKSMSDLGFKKDYDKVLTIDYASRLIERYLGISKIIVKEVNDFCESYFKNNIILGVHYRSTDKKGEAPTVPYFAVKKNIDYYIHNYPSTTAVFISTDDDNFRHYIIEEFKLRPVILREDYFRSDNYSSVHHNKNLDLNEVNRDALINCLLLSRCHTLMKTSSFLSDWSKLFNPSIPVILLNEPYNHKLWFPASQIMKEILYKPI